MQENSRSMSIHLSRLGAIALLLAGTAHPSTAQSPLPKDTVLDNTADPAPLPQDWLPPEDDIPEEILRTELLLEGRSPIDGSLMTPEDYAALEAQLQQRQTGPLPVNSELQSLVFQLKLLNLLKSVFPFF